MPEFTKKPKDVLAREASEAWLHCQADANPKPRITWLQEDGREIQVRKKTKHERGGYLLIDFFHIYMLSRICFNKKENLKVFFFVLMIGC